jgi:hypothetical protein
MTCTADNDPSSRQRGRPTSTKPQLSDSNTTGLQMGLDTKTDWSIDRLRNATFTLTCLVS